MGKSHFVDSGSSFFVQKRQLFVHPLCHKGFFYVKLYAKGEMSMSHFKTILSIGYCFFICATLSMLPAYAQEESGQSSSSTPSRSQIRKNYTEHYRETYKPGNYAKNYRQNYRDNPVFTSSTDNVLRSRITSRSYINRYRTGSYGRDLNLPAGSQPQAAQQAPAPAPDSGVVQGGSLAPQPPQLGQQQQRRPMINPAWYRYAYLRQQRESQEALQAADEMVMDSTLEIMPRLESPPALRSMSPSEQLFASALKEVESRRYSEAEKILRNLLEISSENAEFQMAYGFTLFFQSRYSQAAQALQKGISLANKNLTTTEDLEIWLIDLHAYDFHRRRLQSYVETNPKDVSASTLLLMLPSTYGES